MSNASPTSRLAERDQLIPLVTLGIMVLLLVYAFFNSLEGTARKWESPQYSHGYLIPLFSLVLLWLRFQPFEPATTGARWAGVGLLALGLSARLGATLFALVIPEMLTFLPCLFGIFLLVGGWSLLRWSWPALAFLVFMYPLPDFVERGLLDPLQSLATRASTFCLQTLGFPAFSEGNRIIINDLEMGVVDACSGLRMLTIFTAIAVAVTMVIERPIWERVVIFLSAIPIALAVNVIRITVTGILYRTTTKEIADKVFHDLAGWVMMPLALGLLYVELQILSHLVVEEEPEPASTGLGLGHPSL